MLEFTELTNVGKSFLLWNCVAEMPGRNVWKYIRMFHLPLTCPRKPGLLFLMISWIQNFTQHVKMKKKKISPEVLTILGTAGQDLSEEKI